MTTSYQRILDRAIGETPPTRIDLDRVVRRERRAARRRTVGAGLAAALAVAAGTTTAVQLTGGEPAPPTPPPSAVSTTPADRLAGFPEYQAGTRVVAATAAPLTGRTLTLRFTPPTLDLVLFARCDPRAPRHQLRAEVSVGAVTAELPYCPALLTDGPDGWESWTEFWSATGLAAGEPATIMVRLTTARTASGDLTALPTRGTFALAVAERVRFEEYPLPAPPAALPRLEQLVWTGEQAQQVRADPADPNRRVQRTVRWGTGDLAGCDTFHPDALRARVAMVTQTPGFLLVLIDGVEVARYESWDYQPTVRAVGLGDACLTVRRDDPVTVTVEPEHLTGDWLVQLSWAPSARPPGS